MSEGYKHGGLVRRKYKIEKTNGKPVDPDVFYFVLNVTKDPHARVALGAYAASVRDDNVQLSDEIRALLKDGGFDG